MTDRSASPDRVGHLARCVVGTLCPPLKDAAAYAVKTSIGDAVGATRTAHVTIQ